MRYTWKNQVPIVGSNKKSIFLAGSMDLSANSNWRNHFVDRIGDRYDYYDPTHMHHNTLNNNAMEKHINWELQAMNESTFIVLNFLPESKSPISLVELGLNVRSGKLTVVCPNGFYNSLYVNTICKRYAVDLYENLEEAILYYKELKFK